jgi:uridine kinase
MSKDMSPEKQTVFSYIGDRICHEKVPDKPYVVAIDGVSAAGKSTFTESLAEKLIQQGLRIEIIHIDDFHNPKSVRYRSEDEAADFYELNIDFKTFIESVLTPIKQRGELITKMRLLDLQADTYTNLKEFHITPQTVVLVEGIFLLKRHYLPLLDLKVFLDVDFDTALSRGVVRNRTTSTHTRIDEEAVVDKFRNRYLNGQLKYFEKHKPQEIADIVISNNDHERPLMSIRS